jgi:hypothetical protein
MPRSSHVLSCSAARLRTIAESRNGCSDRPKFDTMNPLRSAPSAVFTLVRDFQER